MHIIAGQPGVGKSTLAMKVAAVVSSGGRWPDGSVAQQGNVVIWSGEDDLSDTLGPRLLASGADRNRVFFVSGMSNGREARPFDPAKDVPALQATIEEAGGVALIIVDPIVSATAADSHKNSETRRGLQPLVDMAAGLNAALLGVTHFSKGTQGRSPIDRVTGSLAFAALARIVMIATKTEEGTGPRTLMRAKSNIDQDEGGFEYNLQTEALYEQPDVIASVVVWGSAVEGTARSVLAVAEADPGDKGGRAAALADAREWLRDFLQDGPKAAKEVQSAGRVEGTARLRSVGQKRIWGPGQKRAATAGLGCFRLARCDRRPRRSWSLTTKPLSILSTLTKTRREINILVKMFNLPHL